MVSKIGSVRQTIQRSATSTAKKGLLQDSLKGSFGIGQKMPPEVKKLTLLWSLPFAPLYALIAPWSVSLMANPDSNGILKFLFGDMSATAESGSAQKNYKTLKDNKDGFLKKLFYFGIPAFLGSILISFLAITRLGPLVGSLAGWGAEWGLAEVWNRIFKPTKINKNTPENNTTDQQAKEQKS